MTTTTRRITALVAALVLCAGLAACSSDDDSESSTDAAGNGGTGAGDATWCNSVQDLLDQSGGGGLSVSASLPELNQAIVSLSSTAPAPIDDAMQTLATTSEAALELSQTDPGSTLPEADRQDAISAWGEMDAWVSDNCGIEVPPLEP